MRQVPVFTLLWSRQGALVFVGFFFGQQEKRKQLRKLLLICFRILLQKVLQLKRKKNLQNKPGFIQFENSFPRGRRLASLIWACPFLRPCWTPLTLRNSSLKNGEFLRKCFQKMKASSCVADSGVITIRHGYVGEVGLTGVRNVPLLMPQHVFNVSRPSEKLAQAPPAQPGGLRTRRKTVK